VHEDPLASTVRVGEAQQEPSIRILGARALRLANVPTLRCVKVLAACSLGGAGHLRPLLPFLDAALLCDHETLVIAPPALSEMVEATGHPFAAGGEPPEAAVAPIRERLPVVAAQEASVLANRELFGRLATDAMLAAMDRVLADWQPDIVLRDPCEYASAVLAPQSGIATAQVAIDLAEVEWGSLDTAAPALEARRSGLVDDLRSSPYVTRFPASLDPSPFPDTRRFSERLPSHRASLPDWWDGSQAPLVYVSFGTVLGHMSLAAEAYRTVMEALAGMDARALLTVGRRFDSSKLGPTPDNIHIEPWVDQADVLGEAALVVCHGGSGTTLGALARGVPVVIVPLFAGQFANGRSVAAAGAGVVLDAGRYRDGRQRPISQDDAPRIAEAIETVRNGCSYRERALSIAAEMAAAPTVDGLLNELMAFR
jgi:UDP:flavonoid glycosyltransferase YjiC (YdhE family)